MSIVLLATLSDFKLERWMRRRNTGQIAWQTKDGKVIPIKEMTDEHLEHTIRMIERREREDREYFEALGSCSKDDIGL